MKKKLFGALLAGCMAVSVLMPITAMADGQKVVTLGADLDENQKTAILKYFGILGQNIKTLYITNQDERNHLASYVPIEVIGTHTYSCALVNPTSSGGIQVKTANLNWVTGNMIATTLSTSGVVNCEVLAASPFEVSGTGALTGIIMAYETATGTQLDPTKKEIATQELITTGTIANDIGQTQATNIVNEIKIQVIEGQVVDQQQVEQIVDNVVEETVGALSEEERAMLAELAQQIAEQQYNFDDMRDTLQRVEENVSTINDNVSTINDNVSNISDSVSQIQTGIENQGASASNEQSGGTDEQYMSFDWGDGDDEDEEEEQTTVNELPADSIMNNDNIDALGGAENVIATDTLGQETAQTQTPEQTAPATDDFGFTIVNEDSYTDQSGQQPAEQSVVEQPVEQPAIEQPVEQPVVEQPVEQPVVEQPVEQPVVEQPVEQPVVEQPVEQPVEEPVVEQPAEPEQPATFTVGTVRIDPNNDESADNFTGVNVISIYVQNANVLPAAGTLAVTDEFGNTLATVDLTNKDQVCARAMLQDELAAYGWTEGTEILVNIGSVLQPSTGYMFIVNATLAQTADAAAVEAAPKAEIANVTGSLYTDTYGMTLTLTNITDLQAGKTVSGTLIMDPAEFTGASIVYYDEQVAIDVTDFTSDAPATFNVTLNTAGTAEVDVEFYDAEGTAYPYTYYIPVL